MSSVLITHAYLKFDLLCNTADLEMVEAADTLAVEEPVLSKGGHPSGRKCTVSKISS